MFCKSCYFHETHATTYQCQLQQLVGKGLLRVFEHPTSIETRFYERTTYHVDDPYILRSIAPMFTPPTTVDRFVIIDLPMEPHFIRELLPRADPSEPTHCPIVIHELAYHA